MHVVVVGHAEREQVGELGRAPVAPVNEVVDLASVEAHITPGVRTGRVHRSQRSALQVGGGSSLDRLQHIVGSVHPQQGDDRIAEEPVECGGWHESSVVELADRRVVWAVRDGLQVDDDADAGTSRAGWPPIHEQRHRGIDGAGEPGRVGPVAELPEFLVDGGVDLCVPRRVEDQQGVGHAGVPIRPAFHLRCLDLLTELVVAVIVPHVALDGLDLRGEHVDRDVVGPASEVGDPLDEVLPLGTSQPPDRPFEDVDRFRMESLESEVRMLIEEAVATGFSSGASPRCLVAGVEEERRRIGRVGSGCLGGREPLDERLRGDLHRSRRTQEIDEPWPIGVAEIGVGERASGPVEVFDDVGGARGHGGHSTEGV